jgi:hypothetical protein
MQTGSASIAREISLRRILIGIIRRSVWRQIRNNISSFSLAVYSSVCVNSFIELTIGIEMTKECKRPSVKIGPQTANTVEVYIGDVRIVASETDIRIEAKGASVEVIS